MVDFLECLNGGGEVEFDTKAFPWGCQKVEIKFLKIFNGGRDCYWVPKIKLYKGISLQIRYGFVEISFYIFK